jgi:hypothetical protein
MTSKSDYFKWLLESLKKKQSKAFVSKVTVSEKAQEASYFASGSNYDLLKVIHYR